MSFFGRAFKRLGFQKDVDALIAESQNKEGLAKTLTAKDLIVLGVAGIIGAGIFVLIGEGIQTAGLGVIPAFFLAAVICAFAGFAYAELASSVPASGSAYAYIYTALGEMPGWLVGWALVLEYAVGAIAVSIAWRNNFLALVNQFFDSNPRTDYFSDPRNEWLYRLTHSPFEKAQLAAGDPLVNGATVAVDQTLHGLINIPSVIIVLLCTLLLVRGTKESAKVTFVLVSIKVTILLLAIVGGFVAFDAANFDDPLPHSLADDPNTAEVGDEIKIDDTRGFMNFVPAVFAAAAIMFFAYIGFDSVSTTAEETKNPKKDMPKGIIGSLLITSVLYVVAAFALSSAAHWTTFVGDSTAAVNARGEPFGYVFEKEGFLEFGGFGVGALLIRIGALVGVTSVLLVLILGGVRVFFNMSRDGLLPAFLSRISKRGAPAVGTLFYGGFTVLFAGVLTLGDAVNLVNIGTLFAFLMVVLAAWIFRIRRPDIERPFRMPMWSIWTRDGKPYIALFPIIGMLGILALIYKLDLFTQIVSIGWMGLGLLLYALYSVSHSKDAHGRAAATVGAAHGRKPALTTGVTTEQDFAPNPGVFAKPAKPAKAVAKAGTGGPGGYRHGDYTLYSRMVELKGGGERPIYFFAKATPKSGTPVAIPAGYEVGESANGLPFLRKA